MREREGTSSSTAIALQWHSEISLSVGGDRILTSRFFFPLLFGRLPAFFFFLGCLKAENEFLLHNLLFTGFFGETYTGMVKETPTAEWTWPAESVRLR